MNYNLRCLVDTGMHYLSEPTEWTRPSVTVLLLLTSMLGSLGMIVTNNLTQSHNENLTPGRSGNDKASTGNKGFPRNNHSQKQYCVHKWPTLTCKIVRYPYITFQALCQIICHDLAILQWQAEGIRKKENCSFTCGCSITQWSWGVISSLKIRTYSTSRLSRKKCTLCAARASHESFWIGSVTLLCSTW